MIYEQWNLSSYTSFTHNPFETDTPLKISGHMYYLYVKTMLNGAAFWPICIFAFLFSIVFFSYQCEFRQQSRLGRRFVADRGSPQDASAVAPPHELRVVHPRRHHPSDLHRAEGKQSHKYRNGCQKSFRETLFHNIKTG